MITKFIVTVLLCASGVYAQNAPTVLPADNPWKPLQFLIGTWEAKTQGGAAQAAGSGTYTFQTELRNTFSRDIPTKRDARGPWVSTASMATFCMFIRTLQANRTRPSISTMKDTSFTTTYPLPYLPRPSSFRMLHNLALSFG